MTTTDHDYQVQHQVKFVATNMLRIAYTENGTSDGWPVILSHGFPYDIHAFDDVVNILVRSGAKVITPFYPRIWPDTVCLR